MSYNYNKKNISYAETLEFNKREPRQDRQPQSNGRTYKNDNKNRSGSASPKARRNKTFMIDYSRYVAMDCEMVGIGEAGLTSILARVTIVDWNQNVLFDTYVRPTAPVTDYRTFVSGITEADLQRADAMDIHMCREIVMRILYGKILVGHALKNDLQALGINHAWQMTRDTAKYEPFMKTRFNDGKLWPRKLRELCHEKLALDIQQPGRPHSPFEDAVAALNLYKSVHDKWEKVMHYKIKKTAQIEQQKAKTHYAAAYPARSYVIAAQ